MVLVVVVLVLCACALLWVGGGGWVFFLRGSKNPSHRHRLQLRLRKHYRQAIHHQAGLNTKPADFYFDYDDMPCSVSGVLFACCQSAD